MMKMSEETVFQTSVSSLKSQGILTMPQPQALVSAGMNFYLYLEIYFHFFFLPEFSEFSSKLVSNIFSPFLFLFSLYLVDNSLVDNDVEYFISVVASSNFLIIYFVAEVDVDEDDGADVLFQKSLVAGSS